MRSIANGAGNFSDGHLVGGFAEASDVALVLREPISDLQAKGDGLGVNAVCTADLRRMAEFVGAQIENFPETSPIRARSVFEASRTCRACAVSTTSLDVMP